MIPTAIFLLSSHGHAVALSASAREPWAMLVQVSGFLFVLLAAALIVTAVERSRGG
jgi:hypothetical protein